MNKGSLWGKSFPVVLGLSLPFAGFAQANPPDMFLRWSGGTAIAPPQGFSLGSPLTLTWGLLPDGVGTINSDGQSTNNPSGLIQRFDQRFGAGPGGTDLTQRPWFEVFQRSFDRYDQLSGLTHVYTPEDDGVRQGSSNAGGIQGVRPDIRIGAVPMQGSTFAFNHFPIFGGDMVLNTNFIFNSPSTDNRFLRNTIMHEHGHGIGMQHIESNRNHLMQPFSNGNDPFDGPQLHDIMVIQAGYGDVHEKSNAGLGNDDATRATVLGSVFAGSPISIGDDARDLDVASSEVNFASIDDETDTDFFKFDMEGFGAVDITLESLGGGGTYTIAAQGQPRLPFDLSQRSDLSLTMFDATGTNILGSSALSGLGLTESLHMDLGAGSYMVRITGADNIDDLQLDTQFYGLRISTNAVPEPASLLVLGFGAAVILRRRK